jgi:hypothetical protein
LRFDVYQINGLRATPSVRQRTHAAIRVRAPQHRLVSTRTDKPGSSPPLFMFPDLIGRIAMRESIRIALRPDILRRSTRIALVVGTLLALINHGDRLMTLSLDAQTVLRIILTYAVPFGVASWSAVQATRPV